MTAGRNSRWIGCRLMGMINELKITIPLNPVTKKNHSQLVRAKDGKQYMIPSKPYLRYEHDAGYWLGKYRNKTGFPIMDRVEITCVFYMRTRHRVDLTNLLGAIDDVLVHYGVIEDDNSQIIVSHDGSRVKYDRDNPRTEITIRRVKNG